MKKDRLLELIAYFETSKGTTEYLINTEEFEEHKKNTMIAVLEVFKDTLSILQKYHIIMTDENYIEETDTETSQNIETVDGE